MRRLHPPIIARAWIKTLLRRGFARLFFLAIPIGLASCVSTSGITSADTPHAKKLNVIVEDIRALDRGAETHSETSDGRADALLGKAREVWATSPNRSRNMHGLNSQRAYEIDRVYRALADYYAATGRPGRAIPLYEEAAAEARALRFYTAWQELSLELVVLYQRLGLVDHARDQIADVLRFLERLGFTLDSPPDQLNLDTVIFVTLHATQLAVRPEDYQDAETLRRLYQLLVRSAEASAEIWGWDPSTGYRDVRHHAAFGIRLAQLGDLDSARRIRGDLSRAHRRNRSLDPFDVVNEKKLDYATSRLGRDLHRILNFPFAVIVGRLSGRIQDRPPSDRRYLATDTFSENFELARIDRALSDSKTALEAADRAEASIDPIRAFYAKTGEGLATKDGIAYQARALNRLRATLLEDLSRHDEAEELYETYIEWSERERSSLPPELRVHFFRGQARAAYQGSIRCSIALYRKSGNTQALDEILAKVERMRARGFQDLIGIEAGEDQTPNVARVQQALSLDTGVFQIIDLETEIAMMLLTTDSAALDSIDKRPGWDREIFRLRNRLAKSMDYDRKGFERLGLPLFGFAASELSTLTRLIVTTDGALSALPLGILPYASGRLLHDRLRVTLVPSLSLWLANQSRKAPIERRALRAFVVGDPDFDEQATIERSIGKERLALRGGEALSYFQRLPETADEARAVLAAFPDPEASRLLLGSEATESRIKSDADLTRYTHIHFATHGVIGNDLPNLNEPALVLGWEEDEDGFLTAREVTQLELDARLTVLSACNTGNGEYFAGEGLMGMGRAFMEAGSARVIVSLWPVESFSTQRMMELFYTYIGRGEPEDRALWLAQQDLRSNRSAQDERQAKRGIAAQGSTIPLGTSESRPFANPFYWSPFVLISSK